MFTDEELRNWESEEHSRLNELRRAGDWLCKAFAKAKNGDEQYRILLDFAARQDNPPEAKPNEKEMPCVSEEGVPPFFLACCRELGEAGLIRWNRKEAFYRYPDMSKTGVAIFILGITYKGRLELARLKREEEQRKENARLLLEARRAKWIRWVVPMLTFSLGVIFSTLVSILFPRLLGQLLDRWFGEEVRKVAIVDNRGNE